MADEVLASFGVLDGAEKGAAAAGSVGGFAALFSAAACCVLPLAFAAVGLGTGGLAAFVPYHWPLTIASGVAVAVGWGFHLRKRRACMSDASCTVAPPSRTTVVMLSVATVFVAISAIWKPILQAPLMAWLQGA